MGLVYYSHDQALRIKDQRRKRAAPRPYCPRPPLQLPNYATLHLNTQGHSPELNYSSHYTYITTITCWLGKKISNLLDGILSHAIERSHACILRQQLYNELVKSSFLLSLIEPHSGNWLTNP